MQALEAAPGAAQQLAGDLAAALDPVVFSRRLSIVPDPWQADVLRSIETRMLLNCSRQSGKTTVTALLGLHQAMYVPNSLVLILSPSLRQSAEFFRTVARLYSTSGHELPPRAESSLRLELANGSRVISLPASEATIRGFAGVNLLLIDEASRVHDDLYASVRPMLAVSNGRLVALSTPFGKRGWWSDAWHGLESWKRVEVPATSCPRISPEFLAEERRGLGQWWFDQEYGCKFLDAETQMFSTAEIDAAFSLEYETWDL